MEFKKLLPKISLFGFLLFVILPTSIHSQSITFEQFFDRLDLEYAGMETVKSAIAEEDTVLAKEELLLYYQNRQDREFHGILGSGSITEAEDNLNGYFTVVGYRQYAGDDDGGIDWTTKWGGDDEWHWQFHRFNFIVDMARVYRSTGESKYAEGWMHLITDWIEKNEPGYPRTIDVGNRLRNWVESYQNMIHVTQAPEISAKDHALMLKSMMEQVLFLRDNWRDERNWGASETRGMGQVVTMFPELTFDDDTDWEYWKDLVLSRVAHHLSVDFHPDGMQVETSPMYHGLEFRNLLQTYSLMEMNGIALVDTLISLFEKPAEFMMHITKPDDNYVMIGSADQDTYLNKYLSRTGEIFERPDFIYVASHGVTGEPADETFKMFSHGGVAIMRDTWGTNKESFENSKYLLLNYTTNEFFHTHFDIMNIEAYANGRTLLIDPGRGTYATADRNYYRSTQAHSTITVNDRNQQSYVRGYADGYAQSGYQFLNGYHDGNPFDVKHRRKVLFAGYRYWIVSDLLTGTGEHTYDAHFKMEPFYRNHHELDENTGVLTTPHFALIPSQDFGVAEMDLGRVSYEYGQESPAPRLRYRKEGNVPETFETVVYPFDDGSVDVVVEKLPAIDNRGLEINNDEGAALKIEHEGRTDFAWFNHSDVDRVQFNGVDVSGHAAFIETSEDFEVASYHLSEGTRLLLFGNDLAIVKGEPATISWHENSIHVEGDEVSDLTLYAPNVETLIINEVVSEFTRDGDYISLSGSFVSTEADYNGLPDQVELVQNFPNPFNPATTIQFQLPESASITLEVFDMIGRKVSLLVDDQMAAGSHSVNFDASALSSGVYVYRLTVDGAQLTKRMTLIK